MTTPTAADGPSDMFAIRSDRLEFVVGESTGAIGHSRAGEGDPLLCLLGPGEPERGVALLASQFEIFVLKSKASELGGSELIEALAEAIGELGVDSVRLLACEDECRIAVLLAASLPQAVERLVLASPPPLAPDDVAVSAAVASLEVPALALRGTDDPEDVEGVPFRRQIRDCQDLIVYDAAAPLAGARPEAFADAVADFLRYGERFALDHAGSVLNP